MGGNFYNEVNVKVESQEWALVEDELPAALGVPVLCYTRQGKFKVMQLSDAYHARPGDDFVWVLAPDALMGFKLDYVKAWTPLPDPPESIGGGDGED